MEKKSKYQNVYEVSHPLILHKLTHMRETGTPSNEFRKDLKDIAMLMTFEITKDLALNYRKITTPLCDIAKAPTLDTSKIIIIPILRAGLGLADGMIELIPQAHMGHIGLYRDEETLEAKQYLVKLPNLKDMQCILVDPMFATGGSAIKAVEILISRGATIENIKFMSLVSAPEGLEKFASTYPSIPVYTAKIDERLNEKGYIVPGLGDAGDRLFATNT